MELDPGVAALLATSPPYLPWYESHDIVSQRMAWRARVRLAEPGPDVRTRDLEIVGTNGHRVPLRVYTPRQVSAPAPGILYLHGGGWSVGDLEICDPHIRRVASGTGAVVVSVDYRLAPENPYPAGIMDCYDALEWMARTAGELGVDPVRLAVAGDSAGAGNAASLSLLARDYGGPPLVCQCLWYPGFLMVPEVTSMSEPHREVSLPAQSVRAYRRLYVRTPDPLPPSASAMFAPDLRALPYTILAAAYFDPLHGESVAFAERLDAAGVDVDFQSFDTLPHGYCGLAAAPAAAAAVGETTAKLAAVLARGAAGTSAGPSGDLLSWTSTSS